MVPTPNLKLQEIPSLWCEVLKMIFKTSLSNTYILNIYLYYAYIHTLYTQRLLMYQISRDLIPSKTQSLVRGMKKIASGVVNWYYLLVTFFGIEIWHYVSKVLKLGMVPDPEISLLKKFILRK